MQVALRGEPARPLSEYAGVYEDSLYGPIRIWIEQSRLALQMGRGEIADLTPHGGDSMHVRWRDPVFGEVMAAHITFADEKGRRGLRMALARDTVTAARRVSGRATSDRPGLP